MRTRQFHLPAATTRLFAAYTVLVIAVVLLPLVYLIPVSLHPDGLPRIPLEPTLLWYERILGFDDLIAALTESVRLGALTSLVTTPLAFLGALATRNAARKSPIIGLFLLPVFMPGTSVGFGLAVYFQLLEIGLSLWTMLVAHVLWTFPFAYIIVLTSMSTFDLRLKEAAFDLGANELRAFLDVELPHIQPGLLGAAIFSFTLSFNEFARTTLVRGATDTLPTYVWGRVQNLGLDPTIYAVSGLTIILSAVLLTIVGYLTLRTT